MINVILLAAIAAFAISVLFGRSKPSALFRFAGVLIAAPILISITTGYLISIYLSSPFWLKLFLILITPFVLIVALRAAFPGSQWVRRAEQISFQVVATLAALPFRLIWRFFGALLGSERRIYELDAERPFVGNSPPTRRTTPKTKVGREGRK